jgi:UDP-glucose 4-epimerase
VLVTGGTGFVGSLVAAELARQGARVVAGAHRRDAGGAEPVAGVRVVPLDVLDRESLMRNLEGVDTVCHFAALLDARRPREELMRVNVHGTQNVWSCAAACGVKRALYCSSTAVYGLLAGSAQPVSEEVRPRAVEPYGVSKLRGEIAALEIGAARGVATVVLRPVGVFGSGDRTPFGAQIRAAATSGILLAGGFQGRSFSFVHAEDVARAAAHVARLPDAAGQVYNVAVKQPVQFEEALEAYIRALRRTGAPADRTRLLAYLSAMAHRTGASRWLARILSGRFAFRVWRPGFEVTYASDKLVGTGFRFRWTSFEDVLLSCLKVRKARCRLYPWQAA